MSIEINEFPTVGKALAARAATFNEEMGNEYESLIDTIRSEIENGGTDLIEVQYSVNDEASGRWLKQRFEEDERKAMEADPSSSRLRWNVSLKKDGGSWELTFKEPPSAGSGASTAEESSGSRARRR